MNTSRGKRAERRDGWRKGERERETDLGERERLRSNGAYAFSTWIMDRERFHNWIIAGWGERMGPWAEGMVMGVREDRARFVIDPLDSLEVVLAQSAGVAAGPLGKRMAL